MRISDQITIGELQEEFSTLFPGLKIEFYKTKHQHYMPSPKNELLDALSKIGDIRKVHTEGLLNICPLMRVVDFEDEMKKIYGLNIQVFRKSIDIWLQTSSTDDWSLAKQNEKALRSIDPEVTLYMKKSSSST